MVMFKVRRYGALTVYVDGKGYLRLEEGGISIKMCRPVSLFPGGFCRRCAHPLFGGGCIAHNDDYEVLDGTAAVGVYYTSDVKDMLTKRLRRPIGNRLTDTVLVLKSRVSVARLLAAALAYVLEEGICDVTVDDFDRMIFVPKLGNELKIDVDTGRRYNQAKELALHLARYLWGEEYRERLLSDVVIKRGRLSMSGYSYEERVARARAVYDVLPNSEERVRGRNVVIVDDIRTSGATGNAIAEKLKALGARKVYLAVTGRASHRKTFERMLRRFRRT